MTTTAVPRSQWASALLLALEEHLDDGEQILTGDITERSCWLLAWAQLEGTDAAFNPLADELDQPGATDFNTAGVKNYPDLDTGIQAVVDTLTGHDADTRGYTRIVTVLMDPRTEFADFRSAVAASAWSGLPPDRYQIPATFAVTATPGSQP